MVQTRASNKAKTFKPAKSARFRRFRRFNELPNELRLMVWDYAIPQNQVISLHLDRDLGYSDYEFRLESWGPGNVVLPNKQLKECFNLFLVSRAISQETKQIFWSKNEFSFNFDTDSTNLALIETRKKITWSLPDDFIRFSKKISIYIEPNTLMQKDVYVGARHMLSMIADALSGRDANVAGYGILNPVRVGFNAPALTKLELCFDEQVPQTLFSALSSRKRNPLHLLEPLARLADRGVKALLVSGAVGVEIYKVTKIPGLVDATGKLRRVLKEGIALEKVLDKNLGTHKLYDPVYDWSDVEPLD